MELLPDLTEYDLESCLWVGADRGVYTLLANGIKPDYAFGDFDSVSAEELMEIEKNGIMFKKFKPEKDETDLELALDWALKKKPEVIRIFGGTGGRLDHMFAGLSLQLRPILEKNYIPIELIDRNNIVYLVTPGIHQIKFMPEKKYVSFFPVLTSVSGLTLTNLKYPLTDHHVPLSSTLCISNELISDYGTFSFSEGILMVVRSSD